MRKTLDPQELKEIGLRFAMVRTKLGYTQADVAKRVGIRRSSYNEFENGYCGLSLKTLNKLNEMYGPETMIYCLGWRKK